MHNLFASQDWSLTCWRQTSIVHSKSSNSKQKKTCINFQRKRFLFCTKRKKNGKLSFKRMEPFSLSFANEILLPGESNVPRWRMGCKMSPSDPTHHHSFTKQRCKLVKFGKVFKVLMTCIIPPCLRRRCRLGCDLCDQKVERRVLRNTFDMLGHAN